MDYLDKLRFYIRHVDNFLQNKLLLVFKSDEAKLFFEQAIPEAKFEEISFEEAENAVQIGIHGKVLSYGYTHMLTENEMDELSTLNWEHTAKVLAEGNERFYQEAIKNRKVSPHE